MRMPDNTRTYRVGRIALLGETCEAKSYLGGYLVLTVPDSWCTTHVAMQLRCRNDLVE